MLLDALPLAGRLLDAGGHGLEILDGFGGRCDASGLEGFDVGLEMSGVPAAFRGMLEAMNHGGKIAMLGIPPSEAAVDWNQVIFKGLIIKGIYGREMYETWYKMTVMLQSGLDIKPVITHRFPASRFLEGFELMASGASGKIILDWKDAA